MASIAEYLLFCFYFVSAYAYADNATSIDAKNWCKYLQDSKEPDLIMVPRPPPPF